MYYLRVFSVYVLILYTLNIMEALCVLCSKLRQMRYKYMRNNEFVKIFILIMGISNDITKHVGFPTRPMGLSSPRREPAYNYKFK